MPTPLLFLMGWNNICVKYAHEGGRPSGSARHMGYWFATSHKAELAADTSKWEVQQGSCHTQSLLTLTPTCDLGTVLIPMYR